MIYDTKVDSVYEAVKAGTIDLLDFRDWVKDLQDAAHDDGWEQGGRECSCDDSYDQGYADGYDEGLAAT